MGLSRSSAHRGLDDKIWLFFLDRKCAWIDISINGVFRQKSKTAIYRDFYT